MQVVNRTDAITYLHVVNLLEPELRAALIVKRTYKLEATGKLSPAAEALPLVADQLVTPFGHFHGEIFFRKRGVDLCILGTIRLGAPATRATARVEVGHWRHDLHVVGDRVWTKTRDGALIPSRPAPFSEMPISYGRAFGGSAKVDGEPVPYPDNPTGRGYCESPEQAIGQLLPNLQTEPGEGMPRWNARPDIAGWGPYPMYWGLRASKAVRTDPKSGEILDVSTELFNHAHPDLILDSVQPGSQVRLSGLRQEPVSFSIPTVRPRVEVHLGEVVHEHLGELDGVFVWVDAEHVHVTWRVRFRYPVNDEELRYAVVTFVE
jgi:hypothetical protein